MLGKAMNKAAKNVAAKQQHMICNHSSIMVKTMKKTVNLHTFSAFVKCARNLVTTVVTIVMEKEIVMRRIMKMIKIVITVMITAIAMILMMTMIIIACLQICGSLTVTKNASTCTVLVKCTAIVIVYIIAASMA